MGVNKKKNRSAVIFSYSHANRLCSTRAANFLKMRARCCAAMEALN